MSKHRCEYCDRPDCDEHRCDNCGKPCEPCGCGGCEFCCAYAMDYCPIRDYVEPPWQWPEAEERDRNNK